MPTQTQWIPPEIFLTHNGVTIYHTYKDDDVDQGPQTYWYTTRNDADEGKFDVRELDVEARRRLEQHPPFLSDDNPAYRAAPPKQRAQWKRQWQAWQAPGGGEEQAIRAILKEAIERGKLDAPPPSLATELDQIIATHGVLIQSLRFPLCHYDGRVSEAFTGPSIRRRSRSPIAHIERGSPQPAPDMRATSGIRGCFVTGYSS
jgi:hypothetical protein